MALTESAASLIAAGIAAGGAVTGAGINAGAAAIRNRKQWKYWQKQHAINLQDWEMMNAYNSPAQQMKRYMKAGLNPNLIYGQSNTTSELNSPPPPQYESPMAALGEGFQNAVNAAQARYVQMRQLQNQEQMNQAMMALYSSKEQLNRDQSALTTQKTALENMKRIAYGEKDYYGKQADILDVNLRSKEQFIKKLIIDTNIASLQNDFLKRTLENRVMQEDLRTRYMGLSNTNMDWRNKYMKYHTNREAWNLRYDAAVLPHTAALKLSFEPYMYDERLRGMRYANEFDFYMNPLKVQNMMYQNDVMQSRAAWQDLMYETQVLESLSRNRRRSWQNFNSIVPTPRFNIFGR